MRCAPLLALGLLTGCAAVPSGPPSLALLRTDVSGLAEVEAPRNRRQWTASPAPVLQTFDAIQVEPVEVEFLGKKPGPLGAIDTARIEATFHGLLVQRLREAGISVAPGGGPGVLQLRTRLVGLRYGDPVRRNTGGETLRSQIRLQSLGIEAVFRNSETGSIEVVTLSRPRRLTSVAERWAEMESMLDATAKAFAKALRTERDKG